MLDSGEISLSLVSQLIEDGIVKNVPKFIKGFTRIRFGTHILRGGAAIVASPFDIYDMVDSTIDLHNCIKYTLPNVKMRLLVLVLHRLIWLLASYSLLSGPLDWVQ